MAVRPRFNPKREYVAARAFTYWNIPFVPGDPFPPADGSLIVPRAHLDRQYGARTINMVPLDKPTKEQAPEDAIAVDPVTVESQDGGYYLISAPWLEQPVRIRGKAKMTEEADRIREEGPPLGFIEGGTQVTVEGGEGGWYTVDAPWLEEAEKLQGRDAAEARQREIHEAGEPDTYLGVTLTAGENGWWDVTADWDPENIAKVQGEENARETAAAWREQGAPPAPFDNSGDVSVTEEDGKFIVRAAWLADPEEFDDEQAANDRATALLAEDAKAAADLIAAAASTE